MSLTRKSHKFAFVVLGLIIFTMGCEDNIQREYIIVGEINKVLILGNSITVTRPVPEIGWNADWGMAASARENDYVHLLIDKFNDYNANCEVRYASVSNFEREFWNYDYSQLNDFRDFEPDLIIVRLGDNVNENEAAIRGFDIYLSELISYITNGRTIAVCATTSFWEKAKTNKQIKDLAERERFIYVKLNDLSKNDSNKAGGEFADPDVGAHPSDVGMKKIADRISDALGIFD